MDEAIKEATVAKFNATQALKLSLELKEKILNHIYSKIQAGAGGGYPYVDLEEPIFESWCRIPCKDWTGLPRAVYDQLIYDKYKFIILDDAKIRIRW